MSCGTLRSFLSPLRSRGSLAALATPFLHSAGSVFQKVKWIQVEVGRIDGGDDVLELRVALVAMDLPEVALERQLEARVGGGEEHADARAVRIRRVDAQNYRHLARAEAHEIARRI